MTLNFQTENRVLMSTNCASPFVAKSIHRLARPPSLFQGAVCRVHALVLGKVGFCSLAGTADS